MKKSKKNIVTTLIENKLTLLGQPEPLKVKYDVHWNPFFKALKMVFATFALEGVSKLKHHYKLTFEIIESLRGLVWHFRLFLCIAMILMTVSSTHIGCLRLKETFLTALKVKHDVQWNPFFEGLKMVWVTFALEGVSQRKNHRQLTSEIIESIRGVVWHSGLLLWIPVILRIFSRTHIVYQRLKEIFLRHLSQAWRPLKSIFEGLKN